MKITVNIIKNDTIKQIAISYYVIIIIVLPGEDCIWKQFIEMNTSFTHILLNVDDNSPIHNPPCIK